MSEFRKKIIRSSATTDEYEQIEDYNRINDVETQINDLTYTYFGHDTAYLPYTHDEIMEDKKKKYIFNPEATEMFIDELMATIDEQYWHKYPLPEDFFKAYNDSTKKFYNSFLYLSIRLAAIKLPSKKPEGHHQKVGNGTFRDLATLANAIVIPYSEETFHRRFEIGIPDPNLPGLFYDIQDICRAIGEESSFFHKAVSPREQSTALEEDNLTAKENARINAEANGVNLEQYLASEDYLKETNAYFKQQENEELKKILGDFNDKENFLKHARIFRHLIFDYNNHETEGYIDRAIKLFLLRNSHSVLSDKNKYLDAHAEIMLSINKIKKM